MGLSVVLVAGTLGFNWVDTSSRLLLKPTVYKHSFRVALSGLKMKHSNSSLFRLARY